MLGTRPHNTKRCHFGGNSGDNHKRAREAAGEVRRGRTRESIFSAFWLRSSVVSVLISLISGSEAFLLHIKIKLISCGGPVGIHARSLLWAASGRRSASHCTHREVLQTVDPSPPLKLKTIHSNHSLFTFPSLLSCSPTNISTGVTALSLCVVYA